MSNASKFGFMMGCAIYCFLTGSPGVAFMSLGLALVFLGCAK